MTNPYEKLVEEHKIAVKTEFNLRTRYGYSNLSNNLNYSFQLADGSIHHMLNKVCFAGLHYFDSHVFQSIEEDDEDEDNNDYPTDDKHTVNAIIVYPYGHNLNPDYHANQLAEYHRALERWCELFSPILVDVPFEQRLEDGIIVDMVRGSDLDCVGAFLVGFRNLHEQGYYRVFNHLMDAGLSHRIAAYGTQLMMQSTGGDWNMGHHSHNTICVSPAGMRVEDLKKLKDSCKLYDQSKMITKTQHRGKLDWTLSFNFYPNQSVAYSNPQSFQTYMEPAKQYIGEGWNRYVVYEPKKSISLLLELLK